MFNFSHFLCSSLFYSFTDFLGSMTSSLERGDNANKKYETIENGSNAMQVVYHFFSKFVFCFFCHFSIVLFQWYTVGPECDYLVIFDQVSTPGPTVW